MNWTPEKINEILEIPAEDAASPVKTEEAKFMYDFIKDHKLKKTCETGFAYAKSGSHIMAATGATHIAMDPFQDRYQNLGLKNVERLGLQDQLDFRPDYSHNVLPKLHAEGRQFDFIFIDGDHKFDGEFVDFYYADLLLEQGGFVLLHDTWMRSTRLLMHFIKTNRKDYKMLRSPLRNISIFQKMGQDNRNGMHFREFYTLRSILSHNLILWMSSGKKSVVKSVLFRIKEAVK